MALSNKWGDSVSLPGIRFGTTMLTGTMSFSPSMSGLQHPLKDIVKMKMLKNNRMMFVSKDNVKYFYRDNHIYIIKHQHLDYQRMGIISIYNTNERLHSFKDRPSLIEHTSEQITKKEWHRNGQLHREGKPARIRYTDTGKKNEYFLYGVNVDREFLETPKEKINITKELKSPNVQYRAMIFQYLGYSYIISKLKGKIIHKEIIKGMPYELIAIENIDVETVVVLKMTCPSTGVFYCERVPPTMEKCKDALAWREYDEKDYEMPEQRT